MNLPNTYFKDFPIEFKEINPVDFKYQDSLGINKNGFEIDNKNKIIIEPDKNGYINNSIQSNIELKRMNTVVINAAVGQGKSYAIIQTIKKYYESDEEYLIIVASPFVSLVQQYCNDIHKDAEIPKNQIYNYEKLGRKPIVNYLDKKVQVLTVNTLLGNPGEDGFKNSEIKRKYINDLINHCKQKNMKVVFVFDEIHDAIHNFKEEYIFNLWKWRDVILKNFIISATFNEASKIVIEYLAELTDRRIKIIESKRVKFSEKQSDLFLYYNSSWQYSYNDPDIEILLKRLISQGKEIDILCFSKALAKNIINQKDSKIGELLKRKFGKENINKCTSDLISNVRSKNEAQKNIYDNDKCNIGTNFKTGVSIKKDNHAFVIILPPRGAKTSFRNKYGIFSNGINSIIQALARQRFTEGMGKGEIHIILPKPLNFDFESLAYSKMDEYQIKYFREAYNKIKSSIQPKADSRYFPLGIQNFLIRSFYEEELKGNVSEEIKYINNSDRRNLNRLEFPTYDLFKLTHGEDYLANKFSFFGDDLSSFVTYGAFTNQFINCNLKEISYKRTILFKENEIQEGLVKYFNERLGSDYYHTIFQKFNDRLCFEEFKNELFNNYEVRLLKEKKKKDNSDDWVLIKNGNNNLIEKQLLRFVSNLKYGKLSYFQEDFEFRLKDIDYTRSKYLLSCMAHSLNFDIEQSNLSKGEKSRIIAFQSLNYFREKIIANIGYYKRGQKEYYYLPIKPFDSFISTREDINKFENLINNLILYDYFIEKEIFSYKSIITNNDIIEKKINSFYSKLLQDFFDLDNKLIKIKVDSSDGRRNVKEVNSIKLMPSIVGTFNFINQPKYDSSELIYERAIPLDESLIEAMSKYL